MTNTGVVPGLVDDAKPQHDQQEEHEEKLDNEKDHECQEIVEDEQVNYESGNNEESGKNEETIPEIQYDQQDSDIKDPIQAEQQAIDKIEHQNITNEYSIEAQNENIKQQEIPSVSLDVQYLDTSKPVENNDSNLIDVNDKFNKLIQSANSEVDYSRENELEANLNTMISKSSKVVYTNIDLQENDENVEEKNTYEIETPSFTNQDLYGQSPKEDDTINHIRKSASTFEYENNQNHTNINNPDLLVSSLQMDNGKFDLFLNYLDSQNKVQITENLEQEGTPEETKFDEPELSAVEAESTVVKIDPSQEESEAMPYQQPVQDNDPQTINQENYDPREEVIQNMNIQMHHLLQQNAQLQSIVEGLNNQINTYQVKMNEMQGICQ